MQVEFSKNVCVCASQSFNEEKQLFLLKNNIINYIYYKLQEIIRTNKFINKFLIFNNKLMTHSIFEIPDLHWYQLGTNLVPTFKLGTNLVPTFKKCVGRIRA